MTWRAKMSAGAPLGLLFTGGILVVDGWLVNRLLVHEIGPQQIRFVSFLIAVAPDTPPGSATH